MLFNMKYSAQHKKWTWNIQYTHKYIKYRKWTSKQLINKAETYVIISQNSTMPAPQKPVEAGLWSSVGSVLVPVPREFEKNVDSAIVEFSICSLGHSCRLNYSNLHPTIFVFLANSLFLRDELKWWLHLPFSPFKTVFVYMFWLLCYYMHVNLDSIPGKLNFF